MARDHRARPVHELLGEPLVECVGEPVLDRPRALLPEPRVRHPRGPVGDVGPGPDGRDAAEQRLDVAFGAVDVLHVRGQEVLGNAARGLAQEAEHPRQEAGVALGHDALEVRDLADLPQEAHRVGVARERHHLRVAGERGERRLVLGVTHPQQERLRRRAVEAAQERERREEVERVGPPVEVREGREAVLLDRVHQAGVEGPELGGRREVAVADVAARPSRDLAHLGRGERAGADPVELGEAGEDHVVDVEVEAHADRVGRHQQVHLPGLVEAHLRVAGPRGERAEHERGPALLAAETGGHLVELPHREDDDGRARRQLAEALRLGGAEGRQAGPRGEGRVRQELVEERPDGLGPEQPRLEAASRVLDAVREDVAALAVGGELDLVHRQEVHLEVERHRLDRAHPVGRPRRDDALLAGDERDRLGPPQRGDAVVVLPCQEPEREADHPGRGASASARWRGRSCRCWWAPGGR